MKNLIYNIFLYIIIASLYSNSTSGASFTPFYESERNETGVIKIGSDFLSHVALKETTLHHWTASTHNAIEGVLNFDLADGNLVYQTTNGLYMVKLINGNPESLILAPEILPKQPDDFSVGHLFVAILKDKQIHIWNQTSSGAITNIPPSLTTDIDAISAGYNYILALKDGNVYGWGDSSSVATSVVNYIPDQLTSNNNVTCISAGYNFAMALLKSGEVVAWGNNASNADITVPTEAKSQVAKLNRIRFYGSVMKENGDPIFWGITSSLTNLPSTVRMIGVEQLSSNDSSHTIALLKNGQVISWGVQNLDTMDSTIDHPSWTAYRSSLVVPDLVNEIIHPLQWNAADISSSLLTLQKNGNLQIWNGDAADYQIETNTDLVNDDWQPLNTDDTRRFYRIAPITNGP